MTSRSRKPAFPHPAPSFLQAVRLTRARPGPPSENDLPPVQPFPGPRAAILPGQLTLDGREVVKYLSTIPAEVPAGGSSSTTTCGRQGGWARAASGHG
jgi:hypothetical protein